MEAWKKESLEGGYLRCSAVRNEPFEASSRGCCERCPDQMDWSGLSPGPLCPFTGRTDDSQGSVRAVVGACHMALAAAPEGHQQRAGLLLQRDIVCPSLDHPWDPLLELRGPAGAQGW